MLRYFFIFKIENQWIQVSTNKSIVVKPRKFVPTNNMISQ